MAPHPRVGYAEGRIPGLGQEEAAHHHGSRGQEVRVALPEGRALWVVGWLEPTQPLAEPVQGDGHDDDGDPDLRSGSDVESRESEQEVLSQAGGADERGDHDHGKALHDHLVDSDQQGLAGGG